MTEIVVARLGEERRNGVLLDLPLSTGGALPPRIGGFVPDLYVPRCFGERLIVGEAKTVQDLQRRHSLNQLATFSAFCAREPDSLLLVAVPWHARPLAIAILRQIVLDVGEHIQYEVLHGLRG